MIVISDASPLISLAAAGELRLLKEIYGDVLVPEYVAREIAAPSRPGSDALLTPDWIRAVRVQDATLVDKLMLELDRGEAEAIALAIQIRADVLLLDERRARKLAKQRGLPVAGVLAVLVEAKARKLIPEIRPVIERMQVRSDYRISPALFAETLRTAGE